MQATFVRLDEGHRQLLMQEAARRGCSLSDLIRQATISFFHLPTNGPKEAIKEQRPDNANVTEASA